MGDAPLKPTAYRTHRAGDLRDRHEGRKVRLSGWVARIRNQGGVIFIDLRDAAGVAQIVVHPGTGGELERTVAGLRREFCVMVEGRVRLRPEGTRNPEMATGEIEVEAGTLKVLSPAEALPFQLDERTDVDELVRLQYRYLDLRRIRMRANLEARSRTIRAMRGTLDDLGFLEVETPTLIRSTPEGARDVLVPSRLRPGHFYALPQSPQLFKQLLMVGGVERYYQIARCYRDEDFRADRQLEFTQLDLEGSFWEKEDVWDTLEQVMVAVVKEVRGITLTTPFPRLTYAESMLRFGTDKPDLRFGMEIQDLSSLLAGSDFRAFAGALEAGGVVRGINIGAHDLARSALDALVADAQADGARGLVWMVAGEDGSLRSPVAKFLTEEHLTAISTSLRASPGDVLLVVADAPAVVALVLGKMRLRFGRPADHDELLFLWVVDFPVFEITPQGGLAPAHHPFTAPIDVTEMAEHPRTALSKAYDLVLNGSELGSGSVRIHDPAVQRRVFEILGIDDESAERRFGWFLRALRYGTPPHAGFAVGLDRLVSILQEEANIREVIPFPKTQTGLDPLTESPTVVEDDQLVELGIDLLPAVREAVAVRQAVAVREAVAGEES